MRKRNLKWISLLLASAIISTSVVDINTVSVLAKTTEAAGDLIEDAVEADDIVAESNITVEEVKEADGLSESKELEENSNAETEEVLSEAEEVTDEIYNNSATDEESYEADEESAEPLDESATPLYVEFEDGTKADVTYGYKDTGFKAPFSHNAEDAEGLEEVIPSSFDSRKSNGLVPSIKDQSPYGTCWSFAATATMEASMMNILGIEPAYSVMHLVWMFYNLDKVDDPQGNTKNDGNRVINEYYPDEDLRMVGYDIGGNAWESTIVLSKWLGAANTSDYPYGAEYGLIPTDTDDDARNTATAYDSVAHLQNVRMISFQQPDEIKKAVMEYGTVGFSYLHINDFYNSATASYYTPVIATGTNHAITLIGWDDNYSKDKFKSYYAGHYYRPHNDGAWLCRNSWGTDFGDKGYFWMSYDDGVISNPKAGCNIFYSVAEETDNYENNYFLDGGNVDVIDRSSGSTAVANIFTANGNEILRAMSIMLANSDISYEIQVYKNPTDPSNPESGEAMLSEPQTGKTDYAGYYTIELDEWVPLAEGDEFAIVFKSINDRELMCLIDTNTDWKYRDGYGYYTYSEIHESFAKEQQSYIGSDNGYGAVKWEDLNEGKKSEEKGDVVRIHAFTDEASDIWSAPSSIEFTNVDENGLSLEVGESYDIVSKLKFDENAERKYTKLVWSVEDSSVATINNKGHVVAKKGGSTSVIATSKIDNEIFKKVNIYVLGDASVDIDSLENGLLKYDFVTKPAVYGRVSFNPAEYAPKSIEWRSSNPKVISFDEDSDDENKKFVMNNPGKTVITVLMNGKQIADYNVSVEPVITAFNMTNSILFDGEIGFKWNCADEKVKAFKIVDASNKVRYSCNKNDEGRYAFSDKTLIGKTNVSTDIYYKVIATCDFYESETKAVAKTYELGNAGIFNYSADDFNNRTFVCDYYYPNDPESHDDNKQNGESIKIKYSDNELISAVEPDNEAPYAKYEFEGWRCDDQFGDEHLIVAGDSANEVFAKFAVWDNAFDIDGSYNGELYNLYGSWSKVKVENITANIEADSVIASGTRIKLRTNTPGAKIYYTLDGTAPTTSSRLYKDYITLEYVKENPSDTDTKVVNIKALAVAERNFDSEVFAVSYTVRAEGYEQGSIPDEVWEELSEPESISEGFWVHGNDTEADYTGTAITFQDMKVFHNRTLLTLGKDYTVKYSNNVNANTDYKNNGYSCDDLTAAMIRKLPCITITLKGDYSGVIKKYFSILPMDISDDSIEVANALVDDNDTGDTLDDRLVILTTNNNKEQKILPIIKTVVGTKAVTLKNKKDYEVIFDPDDTGVDFKVAGSYKVKVKGLGNYTGDFDYDIDIVDALVLSNASVSKIDNKNYNNGNPYSADDLDFTVKIGREYLKRASDKDSNDGNYYVEVEDKSSGTVKVTIIGTGVDFNDLVVVGRKTVTFNIVGTSMKKVAISLPKSVVYKGAPYKIGDSGFDVSIKDPVTGNDLEVNTDYIARYINNTDAGTATFEFTGINGYEGTVKKTFKITPYSLNDEKIDAELVGQPAEGLLKAEYAKNGSKPEVKVYFESADGRHLLLEENKDYKLAYSNNGAVNDASNPRKMPTVKITGKGNFSGTNSSLNYEIIPKNIGTSGKVKITATDTFGGKSNSTITLYDFDANNAKLKAGTDYDKDIVMTYVSDTRVNVKYGRDYVVESRGKGAVVRKTDVIPDGTRIKVTAIGKNNYEGTLSVIFKVAKYDISKANIRFLNGFSVYGKAVEPDYDDMEVTFKGIEEALDSGDYEIIEYINNIKTGNASVTIHGLGDFGGTKTIKFKIDPAKYK